MLPCTGALVHIQQYKLRYESNWLTVSSYWPISQDSIPPIPNPDCIIR